MKISRIAALVSTLLVMIAFGAFAEQTNVVKAAHQKPAPVKTNFAENAKLNSVELKQVLLLAKQSGVQDAAEVETFNYIPGGGRGISVKSKERVDGRNISYDTVILSKNGWNGELDKTVKPFQVRYPKSTTLLRTYEIDKKSVRIVMDEKITADFADKVIATICSKKVRFEDDGARHNFNALDKIIPEAIYKSESKKDEYDMRLSEPAMHILIFKSDKGEVVITGVAIYNI